MPALAGLLMLIGYRTVKPADLRSVWMTGPVQKVVLMVTFLLTMVIPLQYSVMVGVGLSVVLRLRGRSDPGTTFMDVLRRYGEALSAANCRLMIVSADDRIVDHLDIAGITPLIGADSLYRTDHPVSVGGHERKERRRGVDRLTPLRDAGRLATSGVLGRDRRPPTRLRCRARDQAGLGGAHPR